MKADLLLVNGNIHTMEKEGDVVEAVAVSDGNIIAVGTTEDIKTQFGRSGTKVIDLEGQTTTPGLVDSHLHLTNYGQSMQMLNLFGMKTFDEVLQALHKRASETPPGRWIIGVGFDENLFVDKKVPDRFDLDKAAPDHPVYIMRVCMHAYFVNSLALQIANVNADTPDPNGGKLQRDSAGNPTGRLYENAHQLVYDCIPKPTYEELKSALRDAMKKALSTGLTGVHTDDLRSIHSVPDLIKMYRELTIEEDLRLRSNHLIYYPFMEEFISHGLTTGSGDEWIRMGAMKVFADGAFGSRTALLQSPYHDDPSTSGVAIHSQEELNELVALARKNNMSIAVHTIGDKAVDMVIQAIHSQGEFLTHRDRIIHAQALDERLVQQLSTLNAIVDIQPRFLASDFPWVMDRLGPNRLEYAYAWKTLLERGIHCAGGSDAPIEPIEPMLGIHAAVTRTKPGVTSPVYLPEQCLSVFEAVKLFTIGSAYATSEENIKGTIRAGKKADFTVFKDNLFTMDTNGLHNVSISKTIIGGKVVYEA